MTVVSMRRFQQARSGGESWEAALSGATLSEAGCAQLHDAIEWELLAARVRYDAQAKNLRAYGLDPAHSLGPRP